MIHDRDSITHFELANNQRDGSPIPLSPSSEPVTIDDHVAIIEHIYQCMLAKAHNNIKK